MSTRRRPTRGAWAACLVLSAAVAAPAAGAACPAYEIVRTWTPTGLCAPGPDGQVTIRGGAIVPGATTAWAVGTAGCDGAFSRRFRLRADGGVEVLSTAGSVEPLDVTDDGRAIGTRFSFTIGGIESWRADPEPGAPLVSIPPPRPLADLHLVQVNASGLAIGWGERADGSGRVAVAGDVALGTVHPFGFDIADAASSEAIAVADDGRIAGRFIDAGESRTRPFVRDAAGAIVLPRVPSGWGGPAWASGLGTDPVLALGGATPDGTSSVPVLWMVDGAPVVLPRRDPDLGVGAVLELPDARYLGFRPADGSWPLWDDVAAPPRALATLLFDARGAALPPSEGIAAVLDVDDEGRLLLHLRDVAAGTDRLVLAAPSVEPADLDCDGRVGFTDLVVLIEAWGTCGEACPIDVDGDGAVGQVELVLLLSRWTN